MKELLVFSILSIFGGLFLDAQVSDDQWYIKDSIKFRNGSPNAYRSLSQLPQPVTGTQSQYDYFIEGITYPLPANPNEQRIPRNDLFIIYEDGSYFNSHKLASWTNRDGAYNNNGQLESYKLITQNPIEYLYYTNVYEGDDDPNARVTTSTPSPPAGVTLNNLTGESDSYLSINHTLVKGKDFTLIVDLETAKDSLFQDLTRLGCTEFSVCWNSTEVSGIENHILPSPIFNQNYTLGVAAQPTLNGNCATFTTLSIEYSNNIFINLHVDPSIDRDFKNKDVEFIISCGNDTIARELVPLSDAHDPNFTDLVCIREEGDFYYASYVINCTNEVSDPNTYTSATFSFVPPAGADSIEEKIVRINDEIVVPPSYTSSWTNTVSDPFYSISTNAVEPLENYTPGCFMKSSLYAELCIKYPKNSSVDFNPDNYIITDGFTIFGTDTFPIHSNLGLCEAYAISYNLDTLPYLSNNRAQCEKPETGYGVHLSSSYCDCVCLIESKYPPWFCDIANLPTIVYVGIALFLGVVAYLIFRK